MMMPVVAVVGGARGLWWSTSGLVVYGPLCQGSCGLYFENHRAAE